MCACACACVCVCVCVCVRVCVCVCAKRDLDFQIVFNKQMAGYTDPRGSVTPGSKQQEGSHMSHSDAQRVSEKHRETERETPRAGVKGQRGRRICSLLFSLVFLRRPRAGVDTLGARPGVDYNIKTTTKKRGSGVRQERRERQSDALGKRRSDWNESINFHFFCFMSMKSQRLRQNKDLPRPTDDRLVLIIEININGKTEVVWYKLFMSNDS